MVNRVVVVALRSTEAIDSLFFSANDRVAFRFSFFSWRPESRTRELKRSDEYTDDRVRMAKGLAEWAVVFLLRKLPRYYSGR